MVFPVAVLNLAVVPKSAGTDQFMLNSQFVDGPFKKGKEVSLTVGKAIGKLKTIIR